MADFLVSIVVIAPISFVSITLFMFVIHYILWKFTHIKGWLLYSILFATMIISLVSALWLMIPSRRSYPMMCQGTDSFPFIERCKPTGDGYCIDDLKVPQVINPIRKLKKASDRMSIPEKASALSTVKEWARIERFPVSDDQIEVDKSGSLFTREFHVSFTASDDVIRAWLAESPGTSGVEPQMYGPMEKYTIQPGGGAQFAEVRYIVDEGKIVIRVYWS